MGNRERDRSTSRQSRGKRHGLGNKKLRLSSALVAAGRPHTVLPLSGVTHMARQEEVAENLMLLQVEFLKRTLGMTPG